MSEKIKNQAVKPTAIPEEEAVVINYVDLSTEEQGHRILLKEKPDSQGEMEMYVGGSEFASIAKEKGLITPPRPLTHQVYLDLLAGLEVNFLKLEIYDLVENAYVARLYFTKKGEEAQMEVRPSDGIALAMSQDIPIFLNKRLLRNTLSPQDKQTMNELVKTVKF